MPASYLKLGGEVLEDAILSSVEVEEALNAHSWCRVECRQTRDRRFRYEEFLGKPLEVITVDQQGASRTIFSGFVLDSEMEYEIYGSYKARLLGVSVSYKASISASESYYRKATLASVAGVVSGRCGIPVTVEAPALPPKNYVQWGETDFEFLVRLADDHHAWTRPTAAGIEIRAAFESGPKLEWRADDAQGLTDFEVTGRLRAPSFSGTHYDARQMRSKTLEGVRRPPQFFPASSRMSSAVLAQSESRLPAAPVYEDGRAATEAEFRAMLERESVRAIGGGVVCRGHSRNEQVKAGCTVEIAGVLDAHGTYGVTRVVHRWTKPGYTNEFECTPWKDYLAPVKPARKRIRGVVSARVTDNNDPRGMGRIKAQYDWQEEGDTGWARMAAPDAGGDRGFLFLPEIGDEVLVAFEHGDPERPIVLGALWNGVDRAPRTEFWGSDIEPNHVKRIVTKSGHRIQLSDQDGKEALVVATPSKLKVSLFEKADETGRPMLLLHSEDGDIVVSAPDGRIHIQSQYLSREVGGGGSGKSSGGGGGAGGTSGGAGSGASAGTAGNGSSSAPASVGSGAVGASHPAPAPSSTAKASSAAAGVGSTAPAGLRMPPPAPRAPSKSAPAPSKSAPVKAAPTRAPTTKAPAGKPPAAAHPAAKPAPPPPPKQTAAPQKKTEVRCKHDGLTVSCKHKRAPGEEKILEVLGKDTITATTAAAGAPCGAHPRFVAAIPVPAKAEATTTTLIFDTEAIPIGEKDFVKSLWPAEPETTSMEVRASSCNGTAERVTVRVYPDIQWKVSLAFEPGLDASLDRDKKENDAPTVTYSATAEMSIDGVTYSKSSQLESTLRIAKTVAEKLLGLSRTASKILTSVGGGSAEFDTPKIALNGRWGWEEGESWRCGYFYEIALAAEPLLGVKCKKNVEQFLLASWPPLYEFNEFLKKQESGLEVTLSAGVQLQGSIAGKKAAADENWSLEGKIGGKFNLLTLEGKATVKIHVVWVSFSAGAGASAAAGMSVSVTGGVDTSGGPYVRGQGTFDGITLRAYAWAGGGLEVRSDDDESLEGSAIGKEEKSIEKVYWKPANDLLDSGKHYLLK